MSSDDRTMAEKQAAFRAAMAGKRGLRRGAAPKRYARIKPKRSTKPMTKAELARTLRVKALGCLACRANGGMSYPAEGHHVLSGRKRAGHHAMLPLCGWHHQGNIPRDDWTQTTAKQALGPSLALHKREFVERYGSERDLLLVVEDLLARNGSVVL